MTNSLQALLGAKPAAEITEQVRIKRLGTEFTVKALTGDDIGKLRDQASYPVKEGTRMVTKVNEEEVARLIIANGTVDPNFADAQLLKHYGATDAADCVNKALLAGEIAHLQMAIFEVSGFMSSEEDDIEATKK